MELSLADGLKLGIKLFNANRFEIRIRDVERKLSQVNTTVGVLSQQNKRFESQLNHCSSFRRREIEGQAREILNGDIGRRESSRSREPDDESAIVSLVVSLGYLFAGIVIKGDVGEAENYGEDTERTLLLSGHLSSSENIKTISQLQNFTSIARVRIDTKRIRSSNEMKYVGTAISSFYKVLQIFNVEIMPLSDQYPVGNEAIVHVLFNGMFDMDFLVSHPTLGTAELDFFRVVHKNVYLFGQNGAGKSTWGNIITSLESGPSFEVGDSVNTTLMPTHRDVGPNDVFRLLDLPGVGDSSPYKTALERHITDTIHNNKRYSAVIFIFNGKI